MSRSRIMRFFSSAVQHPLANTPIQTNLVPRPPRRISWLKMGAVIGMATSTFCYANNNPVNQPNETYIITIGSLLKLDYQASIAEFIKIASKENKKLTITPLMLQDVFKEDDLFKRGEIDAHEFRIRINKILDVNASDEEFDTAWNAMLGDPEILKDRLKAIENLNIQIAFLSGTNPIHARKLSIDQWKTPVFLSYQQHCLGVECYPKMMDHLQLNPHETTLVLRSDNLNAGIISKRNESTTLTVEEWAKTEGIKICGCDKQTDIVSAIQSCVTAQQSKKNAPVPRL